jgi:hypothetical protein
MVVEGKNYCLGYLRKAGGGEMNIQEFIDKNHGGLISEIPNIIREKGIDYSIVGVVYQPEGLAKMIFSTEFKIWSVIVYADGSYSLNSIADTPPHVAVNHICYQLSRRNINLTAEVKHYWQEEAIKLIKTLRYAKDWLHVSLADSEDIEELINDLTREVEK